MILGFDIGGTKCAVITAEFKNNKIILINKLKFDTRFDIAPEEMIDILISHGEEILNGVVPETIGISCGGPLDSDRGIILGPPNLPGWKHVEIVKIISQHFNVPVFIQNDANACAVAEWKFGAGKNCTNMVFLTFGTGMGAGLILNGMLYTGTNDNAGEIGHIRLENDGPFGYGKNGSFEGFCSGGGIAKLGYIKALEQIKAGKYPSYYKDGMSENDITAKSIAEAATNGDETAIDVFRICGEKLGIGLSFLVDILNPQKIVIGSIFGRCHDLLWKYTKEVLKKEALKHSLKCCKIVPSMLGENIGDYAAIAAALI